MLIDAQQWARAKELFQQAAALPSDQRAAFLRVQCGSDLNLLDEVETLLNLDDAAGSFMTVDTEDRITLRQPAAGDAVGPWRLVRLIGVGGMGSVWLARRSDDEFERQVAVKFIRPEADQATVFRRFAREKKMLAGLDHPSIARLFDAGITEDGNPFIVMEYVDGLPLDQFCDERRLTIRERLELFVHICAAVQHAHASLVIHRDLKPVNILVRSDAWPVLLDFGIAKVTDPSGPLGDARDGRTIGRLMTPDYASPEQLLGDTVTTASDVFSLGVILYEILTGRHPFKVEQQLYRDFENAVCAGEPDPPSRAVQNADARMRTTEQKARRLLEGDIDMIVSLALRKEAHERYASVEQLADDIRRHLNGLPVRARPTTWGYRVRKFVRRNRYALTGVAAAFVALMALSGVLLWRTEQLTEQRNIARQAEERATRKAETAEQVTQFIEHMIESANPESGEPADLKVREALDLAAARLDHELADEPLVAAAVRQSLGRSYRSLGRYEEAAAQLNKALAIYQDHKATDAPEVASCLVSLGHLYYETGDYEAARDRLREALDIRRTLNKETADGTTAAVLTSLGLVEHRLGRSEQAERHCQDALDMDRKLYGSVSGNVATDLGNLGVLYDDAGRFDDAEKAYRESLKIYRKVYGPTHPAVSTGLSNLGTLLVKKGRYDQADPLLREALEIDRKNLGPKHPDLSVSLSNLGAVYRARGNYEQAIELLKESLAIDREVFGDHHVAVAYGLNGVGTILVKEKRYADAVPMLREALAILRDNYGESHRLSAACATNLAAALIRLDRLDEAERLLESAEKAQRELLGRHPQLARTLAVRAELQEKRGSIHSAERLLSEALGIRQATLGNEHPATTRLVEELARIRKRGTSVTNE